MADLDSINSLYEPLAVPSLNCLEKDIEAHRHYIHRTQKDLDKVTFPMGPRFIAQSIKKDMDVARRLYPEYAASCALALGLPPPHPVGWKFLRDEEITHRMLASRLHPLQKVVRLHFETSYPKLLDDHVGYMEQVKQLVVFNAIHRSELSTTIVCDASRERLLVDGFSTIDSIAVPYDKVELEKDQREYRHAPVLNPVTRELEEGCSVILGCYFDSTQSENRFEEAIVVCLERYRSLYRESRSNNFGGRGSWEYYWKAIHMMETSQDLQAVRTILLGIFERYQAEDLIRLLVVNSLQSSPPLLKLTDQRSIEILQKDYWNSPALLDLMKDVHPNMGRILKACAFTYFAKRRNMYETIRLLLCTGARWNEDWESKYMGSMTAIFRRWDFDAWCPLPEDVEWGTKSIRRDAVPLRRMKRFPARPEYGDFAYLEVDAWGRIVDTPENKKERICISEVRPPSWLPWGRK